MQNWWPESNRVDCLLKEKCLFSVDYKRTKSLHKTFSMSRISRKLLSIQEWENMSPSKGKTKSSDTKQEKIQILELWGVTLKQLLHLYSIRYRKGFPGGTSGKESSCQCRRHKRSRVNPWGGKEALDKEMAAHSRTLAWRIPWREKPDGLRSIGLQRAGHNLSDLACTHTEYLHF